MLLPLGYLTDPYLVIRDIIMSDAIVSVNYDINAVSIQIDDYRFTPTERFICIMINVVKMDSEKAEDLSLNI